MARRVSWALASLALLLGVGCKDDCLEGSIKCGSACVDTRTDNANCGACGVACAAGQVCSASACALSCQAGLADCSGSCRDLQSDRANCGACGTACDPGGVCSAGTCALSCQAGLADCGGSCRDLQADRGNCGACGTACAAGQVCSAGACALSCQAGLTSCNGSCRDLQADRANCGACGTVCPAAQVCHTGLCSVTCPLPALASIPPMAVDGGTTVAFDVLPDATCFQLAATGMPAGATFDLVTGQFSWVTTPDDFGFYEVTFTATSPVPPFEVLETRAFITVSFVDAFTTYAGYSEYVVSHPGWEGPVIFEALADPAAADGLVLHEFSDFGVDPYGRAYRVLSRSALPIGGIAYEYVSRDVAVGPACGSGGALELLDVAVTDPAATWPAWDVVIPPPILLEPVDDGAVYTTHSGAVPVDLKRAVTLSLLLLDNSNICSRDVYWDSVRLTPLPPR